MKKMTFILTSVLASIALVSALAATPARAEDPYAKPDGSWISISGTVNSVSPDAFVLDYGDGIVTVEMDDGDRDSDGYKLFEDDKVTVNGMIDDDFFETTTIEASSVYVEKLGTYFYASPVDDEDTWVYYGDPVTISTTVMQGSVTAVHDGEFELYTGPGTITVVVDKMAYDPLDDEGYQKIDVGDRVSVRGEIEYDVFANREFEARSIVTLSN